MEKQWKQIPGYEGLYEVSEDGDVRSVAQFTRFHNIRTRKTPRRLRPFKTRDGYMRFTLSNRGVARHMSAHRIVALAFIPNDEGLPQINHKDENPLNNKVSNLEWCTGKQNCNYGQHRQRISQRLKFKHHLAKPVARLDDDGNIIETYPSCNEAARRMGVRSENISRCCIGRYKRVCGYKWQYFDELVESILKT